jgi:hypothetical protein
MGLDWLDLQFQIEKTHHFKIPKIPAEDFLQALETYQTKDWLGRTVEHNDWKAGSVFELMRDHASPFCAKCHYWLKGLASHGQCPECGLPYKDIILTWENFQKVLGKVLHKEPGSITCEQWLGRDLGFS